MTTAPPPLAPDLTAGLRRLKLAAMRRLAPELLNYPRGAGTFSWPPAGTTTWPLTFGRIAGPCVDGSG